MPNTNLTLFTAAEIQEEIDSPPKRTSSFRLEARELPWLPPVSRTGLVTIMALAAVLLATSFCRLNHTDLWGHLNFGRWIAEHGQLPKTDPFREIGVAEHFVNVPWLSQVLGFEWFNLAGFDGLALAHTLLITLTCGVAMAAVRARGVSAGWAVAGGIAGYLIALPIIGTLRPQLFGELCFALTLLGVSQLRTRRHPLFWLPLAFMAWANLHGSAPLGLCIVAACWLSQIVDIWLETRDFRTVFRDPTVRRFGFACLMAFVAIGVNPTGWRMLLDSARFANNTILGAITEWRPLTVNSLSGGLFFATLVATGLLLRFSPRRFRLYEVILLLGFGFAALGALRMLAWWAIVWPWIVAPHVAAVWEQRKQFAVTPPDVRPTTMRTLIAMAVLFLTLVWSPATHGFIVGRPRPEALAVDTHTPLLVAEEIAKRGLTGRIFSPLDWADYIVWKSHDRVQPLVHSHVHLATTEAWDDYQRLVSGRLEWLEVADADQLRYLVIRRDGQSGLEQAVRRSSRCNVLYIDQAALLVEISPVVETVSKTADAASKAPRSEK